MRGPNSYEVADSSWFPSMGTPARYNRRWYGYAAIHSEGVVMRWTIGPSDTAQWMALEAPMEAVPPEMRARQVRLIAGWSHKPSEEEWREALDSAGIEDVDDEGPG